MRAGVQACPYVCGRPAVSALFCLGGTGSYPDGPNGRHRKIRRKASPPPFNTPCTRNASIQYVEHEGVKRQHLPICGESAT